MQPNNQMCFSLCSGHDSKFTRQLICPLEQVAKPLQDSSVCVSVVFTLCTSSQQANGPWAADGRDSPVQETESRETTTGTTCKEEKLR